MITHKRHEPRKGRKTKLLDADQRTGNNKNENR